MALLEVCVDSLEGLRAAQEGGADRIELCSRLELGGLSPDPELLEGAIERARLPLHVMVRPRAGSFVYTAAEVERMRREIEALRGRRVAGAVLGALESDGRIALGTVRELVGLARPLSVTFHRAFDEVPAPAEALEELIDLGVERVLTSGGAKDAFEGRGRLRELVQRARGRIVVMAGGGVRPWNAAEIRAESAVTELHGSVPFRL